MIRLLQFLIFGHIHKWTDDGPHIQVEYKGKHVGILQPMKCEKCGNRKTAKIA